MNVKTPTFQSSGDSVNVEDSGSSLEVGARTAEHHDDAHLFYSTEIAAIFLDRTLKIRGYTPSTAQLFCLIPPGIGRAIDEHFFYFHDERLLSDAKTVLDHHTPVEKQVWTDDGICYLRRILPIRTVDDLVDGVVITFIDITRQLKADLESRRLAVILKDSNDAITLYDLEDRVIAWNHGAERTYGYSESEALQLNAADLFPANMREQAPDFIRQLRHERLSASLETQRLTKDGRVLDVWLTTTPLLDARGEVIAIATTERNITTRKRLENELISLNAALEQRIVQRTEELRYQAEQLRQSKERMRAVVDTAPDAIITIDIEGLIKSFNPAATRIFGYTTEEVLGKNIKILMPSPYRDEHSAYLARYAETREPHIIGKQREVSGLRKDGTVFPLEINITEIEHLSLYVGIARDVSERRTLEKRIIDLASLEQERIGSEIHDGLGQRLTALTLMASYLEKYLKDKDNDAAEKIGDLKKELQNAGREAHALSTGLAPVPIDPGGLGAALKLLAANTQASTGINCRASIDDSVSANDRSTAAQIYRIAQEAVNNAVKHAEADTITLKLAHAPDEHGIVLIVADDGVGMRSDGGGSEQLGMHIMRHRANAIGASFRIESAPGKGTVIRCELPGMAI